MGFNSGFKGLIIASSYLQRKNMAPQAGMFFYGATCLTHTMPSRIRLVTPRGSPILSPLSKAQTNLLPRYCCGYFTVLACLRDSGQFCHVRGGQTRIVVKSAHYIRGVPNTKKKKNLPKLTLCYRNNLYVLFLSAFWIFSSKNSSPNHATMSIKLWGMEKIPWKLEYVI